MPYEAVLVTLIEQYGAGAVFAGAMDVFLLQRLSFIRLVMQTVRFVQNARGNQIHRMSPAVQEMLSYLVRIGAM